ncbi:MAG: response regulator [Butyrivibrio sp.]|nr:response regulator [Butyrivibrio sp.]
MNLMHKNLIRKLLIIIGIMVLLCAGLQFTMISVFNSKIHTTVGLAKDEPAYMDIHFRNDNTSSWVKQELELNGMIYDATLFNGTTDEIRSWTLRINIKGDCYLNQFWNGLVEVHQNVGTPDEKIQTMGLNSYDLADVELDYIVDGSDLLIELSEGDYIIYYPSEKFKEMPIKPEKETIVGMIFYFANTMDLTDYSIDYSFHREYTHGLLFILMCTLLIIWVLAFLVYETANIAFKKAERTMEIRKSGISCMSEIYQIIYIVDLVNDTLTPVGVSEEIDRVRPKDLGANDQFKNLFLTDASEEYRDMLFEFSELSTIPERMASRNSLVMEYQSLYYGWCRIRFIAMDREKDGPLEKVLFTIEQINDEKMEKDKMLGQVQQAKSESKAKSAFLANMSHEIRTPINAVLGLDAMILRESTEEPVKSYARDIKSAGNMLLSIINGILDFSKLEAGKMELVPAEYSLKSVVYDIKSIIKNRFEGKNLEFLIDVTDTIPDRLYGDEVRLKQVIINLLTNASKYTERGSVRLGIYGKNIEDKKVHLLISVKDTGIGIRKEDQQKLAQRFTRFDESKNRNIEGTGIGMNLVTSLLELMGTELHLVSVYGNGSDFYFELDQDIVSPEPIGRIDWNDSASNTQADINDYEVSFTAPDAKVLVVDDNAINLTVFENLLKETQIKISKASSGSESLKLTMAEKFNIIFMDHMMPGMDGIEAMEKIKSQKQGLNADTPIIMLTANAMQGEKEEYLKKGFADFVSKPVNPDVLEEKIIKYLPKELCKNSDKHTKKAGDTGTRLPELDGIDTTYALEHVGSSEGVINIMKQFVLVAKSDIEELNGYFEEIKNNTENTEAVGSYRIKVHAMKTSAGLCGALQVYGVAAQLENAAKENRVQEILDISPYFTEYWMNLYKTINNYFKIENKVEKKNGKIKDEVLQNLLHQLVTSMNAVDVKSADAIMQELDNYEIDGAIEEKIEELKTSVALLDAETCEKICEEILK